MITRKLKRAILSFLIWGIQHISKLSKKVLIEVSLTCIIANELLEEGNTKEMVDDPLLKQLMDQLYYKGVKKASYLLEHASIRRRFTDSYNLIKEIPKSAMVLFSVNLM